MYYTFKWNNCDGEIESATFETETLEKAKENLLEEYDISHEDVISIIESEDDDYEDYEDEDYDDEDYEDYDDYEDYEDEDYD